MIDEKNFSTKNFHQKKAQKIEKGAKTVEKTGAIKVVKVKKAVAKNKKFVAKKLYFKKNSCKMKKFAKRKLYFKQLQNDLKIYII